MPPFLEFPKGAALGIGTNATIPIHGLAVASFMISKYRGAIILSTPSNQTLAPQFDTSIFILSLRGGCTV